MAVEFAFFLGGAAVEFTQPCFICCLDPTICQILILSPAACKMQSMPLTKAVIVCIPATPK